MTAIEQSSDSARAGARRVRSRRRGTTRTPATPGSPTPSWRCGCSSSSDCLFFGAFIATYLLYRDRPGQTGPTPQDVYNIPFTSVTSFILLMSSLTMVLALAAIQRGDYRRFRVWIMATALFGADVHRRPDLRVHRVHP